MAGEWRKGKPGGKWRGDDAPTFRPGQADPKWKQDKPTGPPVKAGWWLRAALVSAGLIAVVAGFVIYVLIPTPPPKPALVVVGADPKADAGKLHVPLDLYGWLGGRKLIEWAKERLTQEGDDGSKTAPLVEDRNGNPLPLPTEDKLAGFVEEHLKRYDPVVLYLGVHAGVGPEGPHLVGGDGQRVRVGKLLTALADGLTPTVGKKDRTGVVVLLDPARRRPDPLAGHLADSFAARLKDDKEVAAALDKLPKMVVICGASPGERGWESEDLQQTAFSRSVLRGLQGEAQAKTETLRAAELFEFVRGKTEEWAKTNRPTGQRPFLLPDGEKGLERARDIRLYVQPTARPPAETPNPLATKDTSDLDEWWKQHDEFARRNPTPASYSPRAWRRFRELLLRYEQAVRAGEKATVTELQGELKKSQQRIDEATLKNVAPVEKGVPSLALAAATGSLPSKAAAAENQLRLLAAPAGVSQLRTTTATLWPPASAPEVRPAEVHLPLMAGHFYKTVAATSDKPPSAWATAVATRRLAERAAVGLPEPPINPIFPERVWPVVGPQILAADPQRREAEDRLFTSDPTEHETAAKQLAAAQTAYQSALTTAATLHRAADIRDRAFADLPFLGRWAAEAGRPPEEIDALAQAWAAAHEINDLFADPVALRQSASVERVGRLTGQLNGLLDKAFAAFKQVDAALEQPQEQAAWWNVQHQFVTPFVGGRMARLEVSRRLSRNLLDANRGPVPAGDASVSPEAVARNQAAAHARLARAALSDAWLSVPDKDLPTALTTLAQRIKNSPAWAEVAVEAGGTLADRFRKLSDAVPEEYKSLAEVVRADQAHRSAVPLTDTDRPEPAAVAARVLWRELLADHAQRTIRDHWYDENERPYFKSAAELYREHAKRMTATVGVRVPKNAWLEADLPGNYDTLGLAVADGTPGRLTWTSDRRRAIGFQVRADKLIPEVEGRAVVVRKEVEQLPLLKWAEGVTSRRQPVPVAANRPAPPVADELVAADTSAAELRGRGQVKAAAYFRGQRPESTVLIDLNRMPQLVLEDAGPKSDDEKGGRVAIRADPDVPLGSVAILLDYSGSMRDDVNGLKDADGKTVWYPDDYLTKPSKFRQMLNSLDEVLAKLPLDTPITIRVFSGNIGTERIAVPSVAERRQRGWGVTVRNELMKRNPSGLTPLVDAIETTLKDDLRGALDGAKTLLLLTDGVDEREGDNTPPRDRSNKIRARIEGGLRTRLTRLFTGDGPGTGVSLQVVQFGLDEDDAALSELLFKDREEFARLWPAAARELTEQLLYAIRPKLKVTSRNGARLPEGLSTTGLKSTVDKRDPPGPFERDGRDLKWSPLLPAADGYDGEATPASNRTKLQLPLKDGDRLILSFARDGERGIRIRRELYANYWPKDASEPRADGKWRLTVPKAGREFGSGRFEAVGFVERVPAHLLPGSPPEDDLGQPVPDVMWWQLRPVLRFDANNTPVEDAGYDKTVTVRRRYGLKAPAWELSAPDWPKEPNSPLFRRASIAAWVPDDRLTLPEDFVPLTDIPEFDGESKPIPFTTKDGIGLTIRLAVDRDHPDRLRRPDLPPTAPQGGWLVVRVTGPDGQPVQVRPVGGGARPTFAEHRYYPPVGDAKTREYTAVFGPNLSPDALRAGTLRLRVVAVAPMLVADSGAKMARQPRGPADESLRPGDKDAEWPAAPPRYNPAEK